jgi:hypothetical protein
MLSKERQQINGTNKIMRGISARPDRIDTRTDRNNRFYDIFQRPSSTAVPQTDTEWSLDERVIDGGS